MGGGRWDATDWKDYSTAKGYATKTVDAIYTSHSLDSSLDPKGAKRESCDSKDNPRSTPLIAALDVTGSMSSVLDAMAKTGLNTLCTEVYNRKPITDPHIMCMGVGDAEMGDRAPLQVTQFEADIRIAKQLEKLFLESGGGGNHYESYALAWYFAATQTKIDSFTKRQKKGYIFTVGDENPTPYVRGEDIERVLGHRIEQDRLSAQEILTLASRQWEVYHVIVAEGSEARTYPDRVRKSWTDLLGERALWLDDHKKLAEVIVSAMQINEGADADAVAGSWDGSTSLVVRKATKGLSKSKGKSGGIVTL